MPANYRKKRKVCLELHAGTEDKEMCTRYYMEMSPHLRPIVEKAKASALSLRMRDKLGKPLKTEGEIRPTDMVPVIAPDKDGSQAVFPMVWGYTIPGLNRPVVNARVETAPHKAVWKDGWYSHRCIIPASYYFEWEHIPTSGGKTKAGDKYMIQPQGSETTYLAGLYRLQEYRDLVYPVFTVLTRDATEELKRLHDRMPLILPASMIDNWIDPHADPEALTRYAVTDLFFQRQ